MTIMSSTPATAGEHSAPVGSPAPLFFTASDFEFAARSAIGHAAVGISDAGRVLATLGEIADNDPTSWYDAWRRAGDDHRARAEDARAEGHTETAAAFFLAASEAYDQALAFVDGMPDDSVLLPTFRLHRKCWDDFIASSQGRHLGLDVPYEGDTMPGYLLRPSADGTARPTVVVVNGSDGALSGLWATIIAGSLGRGWNVYVFDGPGQQSMLFERDIPFRPDWEAVVTPVLDVLCARPDVDETGLLAYGISQGGYWLPRALAFEHRFVAAVADGGVVDVSRAWFSSLPPVLRELFRSGNAEAFNAALSSGPSDPEQDRVVAFRARPYGAAASPFDLFTKVGAYQLGELVGQITTPLLITDPDGEGFFAGQSQELADGVAGLHELVPFTTAQGAAGHCEPMARALVTLRMNDFYADHLAARPAHSANLA